MRGEIGFFFIKFVAVGDILGSAVAFHTFVLHYFSLVFLALNLAPADVFAAKALGPIDICAASISPSLSLCHCFAARGDV